MKKTILSLLLAIITTSGFNIIKSTMPECNLSLIEAICIGSNKAEITETDITLIKDGVNENCKNIIKEAMNIANLNQLNGLNKGEIHSRILSYYQNK